MKRKKWSYEEANKLFNLPFFKLIFKAQKIHRINFNPQKIQISTLLSIKTGYCPEDCKYCAQSSRYKTKIKPEKLLKIEKVLESAKKAKQAGSTRFCMGAAWRNPNDRDIPYLEEIIKKVKLLGMETCMTLGSINKKQAKKLAKAGLDFYNHNLDTSKEFYSQIITTRTYEDRLKTIKNIRKSGIKICSGGIMGLGEKNSDRISLLVELANLEEPPESIPINMLVKIKGTPLFNNKKNIDTFDFIRIISTTRIMMPKSYIRLSAGRNCMSEEMQTLCFIAGSNSIFYGCKLLTTSNPEKENDLKLFKKLNLSIEEKINNKEEKHLNKKTKNFYNAGI